MSIDTSNYTPSNIVGRPRSGLYNPTYHVYPCLLPPKEETKRACCQVWCSFKSLLLGEICPRCEELAAKMITQCPGSSILTHNAHTQIKKTRLNGKTTTMTNINIDVYVCVTYIYTYIYIGHIRHIEHIVIILRLNILPRWTKENT